MNKIEKENIDYKNFLNDVLQQIENAKIQATILILQLQNGFIINCITSH